MINIDTNNRSIKIEGLPPKADNLNNYRVIVNEAGLIVTGPMTRYYHWYSRYPKPMEHQVKTADFVCRYKRGFILNDIGTGKTLIAYWLADYLQKEGEIKKTLMIAPLSTLEGTHATALREHFPHMSYNVLYGSKKKRLELLKEPKDIYIINYDGVIPIASELVKRDDIDAIFIDEIATLRNHRTKRWKAFQALFGAHTNKLCWGMSGLPMPKAPTDCYGQVLLINPASLPQKISWRRKIEMPISWETFRDQTMIKGWGKYEWKKRKGWEEVCKKAMQPSIRFEREACCDLPECVEEVRDLELSPEQKKAYKDMTNLLKLEIASGEEITALNEAAKLEKLAQIACGGVYDENRNTTFLNPVLKFEELYDIIASCCDSHILVFVPYKNMPAYIAGKLNEKFCSTSELSNGNYKAVWIASGVSKTARDNYYKQFIHGSLKFIVATPHCMSHGLNLQDKCWVVIWWSPIVDYEKYAQANGRICRPGQKKKQIIFKLRSAPVERAIYEKLNEKQNAQNILLDVLKTEV